MGTSLLLGEVPAAWEKRWEGPSTAGAWLVIDEFLSIPAISGPPERPPRVA